VGNRGREKKETKIHREQDGADRSRHDNKQHRAREREEYRWETEDRAHICQEVLGSVCDIVDGTVLYMGVGLNVLARS